MRLTLSSAERAQLQKAIELIASPLDAPTAQQWRSDVLSVLAPLFQADAGAFVFSASPDDPAATLLNRPQRYVEDYLEVQSLDASADMMPTGSVACTESICRGDRRVFTESEIYSVFFSQYGIQDGVFSIFGLADRPPMIRPGVPFHTGGVTVEAILCLYGDRAGRPRFGAEGLELMGLLRPMLRAGAQAWKDVGVRRSELMTLVDVSTDAISVHDASGATLHRNRVAAALLCDAAGLASQAAAIAREAAVLISAASASGETPRLERTVVTPLQTYVLRATWTRAIVGPPGAVIVSYHPQELRLPGASALRRFGLTARESEVALQLARGAANKDICRALGISESTARRHTEAVFRKLKVRSRSEVAVRLLGVEV